MNWVLLWQVPVVLVILYFGFAFCVWASSVPFTIARALQMRRNLKDALNEEVHHD